MSNEENSNNTMDGRIIGVDRCEQGKYCVSRPGVDIYYFEEVLELLNKTLK